MLVMESLQQHYKEASVIIPTLWIYRLSNLTKIILLTVRLRFELSPQPTCKRTRRQGNLKRSIDVGEKEPFHPRKGLEGVLSTMGGVSAVHHPHLCVEGKRGDSEAQDTSEETRSLS